MIHEEVERIHILFNNRSARKLLLKIRAPLFLAVFVLLAPNIKPDLFVPGFFVSLFGSLIQCWCFGSLNKNKFLAMQGPYVLVRNPMYLGRFFLLFGCVLLTGNIWLMVFFASSYYFYMVNRVKREEGRLKGIFGGEYLSYCRQVNRFVPCFRKGWLKSIRFFRWDLFCRNNGQWNFAAVLASYGFFYLVTFVIFPAA